MIWYDKNWIKLSYFNDIYNFLYEIKPINFIPKTSKLIKYFTNKYLKGHSHLSGQYIVLNSLTKGPQKWQIQNLCLLLSIPNLIPNTKTELRKFLDFLYYSLVCTHLFGILSSTYNMYSQNCMFVRIILVYIFS